LESCWSGKPEKRAKWEDAFGLSGESLVSPEGKTNGILTYYFFMRDYGVHPDPVCGPGSLASIAPVSGSTVTGGP
jgi:hypothetical protein